MPNNISSVADPFNSSSTQGMFSHADIGDPWSSAPQGYTQGPRQAGPASPMPLRNFNMHVAGGDLSGTPIDPLLGHPSVTAIRRQAFIDGHQSAGGKMLNYDDPWNTAHFSQSLGIHPDPLMVTTTNADNNAFQALHPTSPPSDYGTANYRERLMSGRAAGEIGLQRQNQQLQPPDPLELGVAHNGLDALDKFAATKKTAMAGDTAMANVMQSRAQNHMGPVSPGGIPPDVWLGDARERSAQDKADLDAAADARDPFNKTLQRDSFAGRMADQNQIADNNASIDRLNKFEYIPPTPRSPADDSALAARRAAYAQQQTQIASDARMKMGQTPQALATQRAQAVNTAIANGATGTNPKGTPRDIQIYNTQMKAISAQNAARVKMGLDPLPMPKPPGSTGATATGGLTQIQSEDDYDALPSGSHFIDPAGKHRVKP